MKSCIGPYLY